MPVELQLLMGLALSSLLAYAATPLAIRLAHRFDFYDRPAGGYKDHGRPTPYLGGVAVLLAFTCVAVLLGGDGRTAPIVGGAVLLGVVGTLDDRFELTPSSRMAIEAAVGVGIWAAGLGWDLGLGATVDIAATVVWLVVLINAFNIFDNMDGVASSMAGVVSAGLVGLGLAQGDTWLAVVAAALCGSCLGFLPHNLARPARVFLGDGGSMPVGFILATLTMIGVSESGGALQSLVMGAMFVGLPVLDMVLRIVARRRISQSIFVGGRDGIAHWTKRRVRTARAVVMALGGAQALVSILAIVATRGGSVAVVPVVFFYLAIAGAIVVALDVREVVAVTGTSPAAAEEARRMRLPGAIALLVPLTLLVTLSLFFGGYYDSTVWVPAGLAALAAATAGLIARPIRLTGPGVATLCGLTGLGVAAVTSSLWADSIQQAVLSGNRYLAYAAFLALALTLLRTRRDSAIVLGLAGALGAGAGAVTLVRMLGGDPASMFVDGRLDQPLGYINGEAGFFLLALWPCLALAERPRPLVAGAGLGGVVLLGALLVLSESRGAAIALVVAAIVVLAVFPRRVRRAWALLVAGGVLALVVGTLLEVYRSSRGVPVPADVAHAAALTSLVAATAAGIAWGVLVAASQRLDGTWLRTAPAAGLAVVVLVAAGMAVAERSDLSGAVKRQYDAFVTLGIEPQGSSAPTSRLVSGAGSRYDYWRVAWDAFKAHPGGGVGAGNYDETYLAKRTTAEDIRQPHSIELQALSELGLLGGALLVLMVTGVLWGALRLARTAVRDPLAGTVGVAATGTFVAWLAHSSVDWLHLLPGITALALLAVAALVRPWIESSSPAPAASTSTTRRLVPALLVAVAVLTAGASLSRQGMAEHLRNDAEAALVSDPAKALNDANSALRLDQEDMRSYYIKAAAQARFGDAGAAEAALNSASRKEPGDFVPWALLGDLALRRGEIAKARRSYRHALMLNPLDPSLRAFARDPVAARTTLDRRSGLGG